MRATSIECLNRYGEKGVKLILTIPPECVAEATAVYGDAVNAGDLDVKITKYRHKRSVDANAYMWQLLGQLAEKLETTAVEIYQNYVRQYGIYKDFLLTDAEAQT